MKIASEKMKQKTIAEQINNLMLEYGSKLDNSLALVKKECDEEDFLAYRNAVGKLLAMMLTEVMNPLYKEHPDLKPKELD
jgi:hypothetical protein